MTKKISLIMDCLGWKLTVFAPAVGITLIIEIHILLCLYLPEQINLINNICVFMLQISGGLLIFLQLNNNLEVIKNENIFDIFEKTLKTCPCRMKTAEYKSVISAKTNIESSFSKTEFISDSIEEKIEFLLKKTAIFEKKFKTFASENKKTIKTEVAKINQRADDIKKEGDLLEKKLQKVFSEGFKWQIFGFLLLFYSSFLTIFIL
ncbi:MAG: hypothetical protein AB7E04_06830 [Desulfobacteraceae bacterium]